ncbi:TIGR02186 family protein [Phyllobacterium lublinensis]|uniref:TIGR02186 family protein n=1 Tax=Phyllobacterium lublinensis TaxID=2875708 RepID=UPI001CCD0C5C|nr:TIGR02186 family protein [Phyllobacterium sp. 2063]MBZ9656270.1 TIGR02186 family protein [Phyllobacterium sp. 2063]
MSMCAKALALAIWLGTAAAAFAQQPLNKETVEIGLSTDTIAITSGFRGTDLTVFGALDNADPLIQRQGRYDVVVILQGPERDFVVRRKDRFFGIWVNTESVTFQHIPASYSLASTRSLQDITTPKVFAQLGLGINNIFYEPMPDSFGSSATLREFSTELPRLKLKQKLYSQRMGDVQFLSSTLFRATLSLPANVPVGKHVARAYLFRNGEFLRESATSLNIVKAGLEFRIYRAANQHSLLYGLFAVFLAVVTGWMGRLVFRKD